ncbi:unnamed protein product [Aureobasidium uvarum]|uniref:Polyketide synthase n=1 Tax=Aureobasidium uvarum TaxID=2773716 RepID=A0A9N8KP64_9PEZI|nr:unnamed protein product [Aureobasidium uvarum]
MSSYPREPIAIIGSACRFPGSSDTPSKLWDLLKNPRDVLKEFPADRLNLQRFYHQQGTTHGSTNVANYSYLLEEDPKVFDANFFGISPPEAESMDPQQRMLLEVTYEAMEAAGYPLESIQGSQTSVHVGVMNADYADIQNRDAETMSKYNATGTVRSILSNRVSYVFDLHGPSITLDTACSSSLVAMHQAVQCLQAGECDTAIVGGVNLILDPLMYITESKLSMLSPDSRSRMWDTSANGYARGEGIAALLLKPLSQALKCGDPIQAIVRGTGVNSDGRSPGITMPTAAAQAALIRRVYQQAGLDPVRDRCQFFECHGTGTKAGDPVEAQAISQALFSPGGLESPETPLYVGSIKTVIGHTEGCAGLAGVIKAILAIKNETIPPNMLFKELNPALKPFYAQLRIPVSAVPWPFLAQGTPKRVSVNSFGFGGTNSHAIIEEYLPQIENTKHDAEEDRAVGPLVLSAHTGLALLKNVESLYEYLLEHPSTSLAQLALTLQTKRTTHKIRAVFARGDHTNMLEDMQAFIMKHQSCAVSDIGFQPQLINRNEAPGVLGVFTGQGAQWATMGCGLLSYVALFRTSITRCETVLNSLPDAPSWSLLDQLKAVGTDSRLAEAAVSQPLCTAIQIALVDVLKAAGVRFHAVVGHSSGEIAAAYAAGILTLPGAMQIAYYRGVHAHLAKGRLGEAGGMIASGLSYDEAVEFCARPKFNGRLSVAASNSPTSVTLSGDLDAIEEAKQELVARDIFARPLRVDTAYHSHHMQRCSDAYLQSLSACDIQVSRPIADCVWSSSVRGDTKLLKGKLESLKGPYWIQNMEKTVFFSQALESALTSGGPFDVALEIGPHPALKGPAEETLKAAFGSAPIYAGVLKRNHDDVDALSAALGSYWSVLGAKSVDFAAFRAACSGQTGDSDLGMLTNLPTYSWDHSQSFWRESRVSRRYRLEQDTPCELLGRRMPDDSTHEYRWRNFLTLEEIPWLSGHEILGEVLMPGAGYISIALEAGKRIAGGRAIQLLEAQDFEIHHPVAIPAQSVRVETIFTARIRNSATSSLIEADFDYSYWPSSTNASVIQACSGRIKVYLGEALTDGLPPRCPVPEDLLDVSVDQAYDVLQSIGLNYQGIFRGMTDIKRMSDHAVVGAEWDTSSLGHNYLVHPALLDVVFQTSFIAKSYPANGLVRSAMLPVKIDRVAINPCVSIEARDRTAVQVDSFITHKSPTSISSDMHVYSRTNETFLEVEGLELKIAAEPEESDDVEIFCETVWTPDTSVQLVEPSRDTDHDSEQMVLAETIERVSLFYLRKVLEELNAWLQDTLELVHSMLANQPEQVDLQLVKAIGENLSKVVTGEAQLLEVMLTDNMLSRLYVDGCGFVVINKEIETLLHKITQKFPRAHFLEVGAGTGGTTKGILNAIGNSYDSYTFTDISTGFFEKASERLEAHDKRISFKALDIEKSVVDQGFEQEAYDVIIAVNVLHATHDLQNTMRHVRSLLKPGGYLILGEITNTDVLRYGFIMGGLPGWWLGGGEGRRFHPCISVVEWDQLLQETGFSGADLTFNDLEDDQIHSNTLLVSRSVDLAYEQIREPLTALPMLSADTPLLLIGGSTLPIAKVRTEIQKMLPPAWKARCKVVNSIDALDVSSLEPETNVICMQELDCPLFSRPMTAACWSNLQILLLNSKRVVWLTRNRRTSSPESGMFVGIARALEQELPHLTIQMLDLEDRDVPSVIARHTMEMFVRLTLTSDQAAVDGDKLLWTLERETVISNGQTLVPRILPVKSMNKRFNASRRETVQSQVSLTHKVVELRSGRRGFMLVEVPVVASHPEDQDIKVKIKINHALPCDLSPGTEIFLCTGVAEASGKHVVILSRSNQSHIYLSQNEVVYVDPKMDIPEFLLTTRASLIAYALAKVVGNHDKLLVHGTDEVTARVFQQVWKDRILFSTSQVEAPENWIRIHSRSSVRFIRNDLPGEIHLLLDCSDVGAVMANLGKSVPSTCRRYTQKELWQQARETLSLEDWLVTAIRSTQQVLAEHRESESMTPKPTLLRAADLSGADAKTMTLNTLTDWTTDASVAMTVRPLEAKHLFRSDRTYLMIGLTGAMGITLCQWAIENGARTIVLTSRSPKTDQVWLAKTRRLGADVRIMAMDISERASVESVIKQIQHELPPLAGVCNGAMVLRDKSFLDMDVEDLNLVLQPKVKGSQNLDEVLGNIDLDFFIFLSSCAAAIGNPGQANYHAANLFMAGLAAQRRQRGLTASVIHLGYIADVGYVTRQAQSMRERLERLLFQPLSASDIHNAFAEAIVAGRPDQEGSSFDIIMGMGPSKQRIPQERQPYYFSNPRFAHFNPPTIEVVERASQQESGRNVKQQISEATSEDEAVECVFQAFRGKLASIMQLSLDGITVEQPLMDVGIDSLVAVEIRNWFTKELGATKKFLAANLQAEQAAKDTVTQSQEVTPAVPTTATPAMSSGASSGTIEAEESAPTSPGLATPASTNDQAKEGNLCLPGRTSLTLQASRMANESKVSSITRESLVSKAQTRVWFLSNNTEDSSVCNLTFLYEVDGALQVPRLEYALKTVMQRHDALRSCFYMRPGDNQLLQGVVSAPRHIFQHIRNADPSTVSEVAEEYKSHSWNLAEGPVFGMTVVSQSLRKHTIVLGYHHIIMDAFSLHLFLKDLNTAYGLRALQPSPTSYLDYVDHEQQLAESSSDDGEMAEMLKFWGKQFETNPTTLPPLPMARVLRRPASIQNKSVYVSERLDKTQWATIVKASRSLGVTPFNFHLTVLQIMLARFADVEDLCIGVADANRNDERYGETIGFFMNLLPIRLRVSMKESFGQLARNTSRATLDGLRNSRVAFDRILDVSKAPRSAAHTPLFQASINYRMGAISEVPLGDCKLSMIDGQDATNPFDISLGVLESHQGSTLLEMICNSDLYDFEGASVLMQTFMRLLLAYAKDPLVSVDGPPLYDPVEAERSIEIGMGPRMNSSGWQTTVHDRFASVTEAYKDDTAIVYMDMMLTYTQLNARARSIAKRLREDGCVSGSRVGILCEPSPAFVASMLAVLQIGAVYLPLDVSLSAGRHASIIRVAQPSVIICSNSVSGYVQDVIESNTDLTVTPRLIIAESVPEICDDEQPDHTSGYSSQDSPAALLFTSGSTGRPKGIFLTQTNLLNHIAVKTDVLSLGRETILQQSSFGFDMSMIQTLTALLNGGKLVIVPSESRRDPIEIMKIMRNNEVTLTIATPSEYKMWLRYGVEENSKHGQLALWRHACLGGEPVPDQLRRDFELLELPNLSLTNCYGPTEITAAATFQNVPLGATRDSYDSSMTVGKALPNYSIRISDVSGNPLPIGVLGEICIGGAGVALGYCDLPEQTAENFIRDSSDPKDWPFTWMYRTGDQGRLLRDGTLLLMGRMDGDTQVKVRGVRMELQEIEDTILAGSQQKLSAVIVTVQTDRLLAYATLATGVELNEKDRQQLLISSCLPLPDYMWPAKLTILEVLPLTPTGKFDRRAVEALTALDTTFSEADDTSCGDEARLTLLQGELRLLWERVLDGPNRAIVPEADFFHIGGNSMSLMRLQGAIKESMGLSVSTRVLYQASNLRQMAAAIELQKNQRQKDEVDQLINWNKETEIPLVVQEAATHIQVSCAPTIRASKKIEILLTGATSFLGGAILKALTSSLGSNVSKIHCIAVLPDEKKVVSASDSVIYYSGSLFSKRLGLSSSEFEHLESVTDLIIHAGATGHCLNAYQSLRTPNLQSTHLLAALALPRSIPVLYVSSNRVGLLSGKTAYPPLSLSAYEPPKDGSEGYTATKWASEVILEKIAEKFSLPVQISRSCVVVGTEAPNSDALNAILRYSLLIQTVPSFGNVEGFFDFKDVHEVAHEIVEDALALRPVKGETCSVRFRHHSSGIRVSMAQLREHMEGMHKLPFEQVHLAEWIDKALQAGIDPLITAYLEAMVEKGEVLRFPFLGEQA